jgi:hypothetical protein
MATLTPAPSSLGLASPALGPWFRHDSETSPTLAAPDADLAVAVSLADGMEWRAPANGTLAYAFATPTRPPPLAGLRKADSAPAFADGALVLLFTLLPEVELRLAALSNVIPSPDGQPVPANVPGRPPVRHLALEIPAASVPDVDALEDLRPQDLPSHLSGDAARAAYLGLALESGALGNASKPVAELHRPAKASAVLLANRSGGALSTRLWAFDDRGRALDPGAVAGWWAHLASPAVFDNLWADEDADEQRTAAVAAARTVLFCNPHEGRLPDAQRARLVLSDLTQVDGALYTVGAAPAARIEAGPDPDADLMPLPRLALLPNGGYLDATATGTAPFSGWTGAGWPAGLARDFARIAVAEMESHLVGVDRADAMQRQPGMRVPAQRNTSAAPFLATVDAVSAQVGATLAAGAAAQAMAPVMDEDWGAIAPPAFGAGALPQALSFTVHALRGEGTAAGDTVGGQRIAIRFPAGSLPANAWIRVWPHGLDTATGLRFRQDGGAGRSDASGRAFVVTALADGTAAGQVPMSFDALLADAGSARYYPEQRFSRPALLAGGPDALPAPPGGLPSGRIAWVCERGVPLARGAGALGGGETLLALPADEAAGEYALVDRASLDDSDFAAGTLRNAVGGGDLLIVTAPAFADTPEGEVVDTSGRIGARGAAVLHRGRNGFVDDVAQFGRPVPTMERREVAALDPAGGTGVIGSAPGRASTHEALPAQLGHPGMPASAEIHGAGTAIAGPLAGSLELLMRERAAADLAGFISIAQAPANPPADPGGTTAFGAILETLTHGITGDALLRAFVSQQEALGGFLPGRGWLALKASLESAIPSLDIDALIDGAGFDDDTLAAALDRAIVKTRDGAAQAAVALQAAIGRAEDFVYLETPAIDALTAGGGAIDLVGALRRRIAERPGLTVLLCVPERFLPGQPKKLETLRRRGIGAALKALRDAAPASVALFTPTAGSGRPLHMASTTAIVDDALLLTGSTHLWRRGLSFDSSLAVAMFDEAVARGRPNAVRAARRQLLADRLAIPPALVPDDPRGLCAALLRLNAGGGLMRVVPDAYPAADDPTTAADLAVWNPDGRPGGTSDWYAILGGLSSDAATELGNAAR